MEWKFCIPLFSVVMQSVMGSEHFWINHYQVSLLYVILKTSRSNIWRMLLMEFQNAGFSLWPTSLIFLQRMKSYENFTRNTAHTAVKIQHWAGLSSLR